jgi:hypothetical protein
MQSVCSWGRFVKCFARLDRHLQSGRKHNVCSLLAPLAMQTAVCCKQSHDCSEWAHSLQNASKEIAAGLRQAILPKSSCLQLALNMTASTDLPHRSAITEFTGLVRNSNFDPHAATLREI